MLDWTVTNLTGSSAGAVASLGAAMSWSVSVVLYRKWGVGRSPSWLNLFKGIVALFLFLIAAMFSGSMGHISVGVILTLALSGLVGVLVGDLAFFAALPLVGSALTSTIQCLAPSLTGILAWMILGELLSASQIIGLVVTSGCLAALLYFESRGNQSQAGAESDAGSDSRSGFRKGVLFAVIAAVSQALGVVIARPALTGLSPVMTSALRLWTPVLCLLIWETRKHRGLVPLLSGFSPNRGIVMLTIAGFIGSFVGLALMMYGVAHAPLGVALALNSTYPVWIVLGERVLGVSSLRPRSILLVVGSVLGIWCMV